MEMRDTVYFVSESLGVENLVLHLPQIWKRNSEKSALRKRGDHGKKAS